MIEVDYRNEKIPYTILSDNPFWENKDENREAGNTEVKNIMFGRFLKLRKESFSRIDMDKLEEEVIENGPNEFLEEEAHFIMDTENNIILARYNPHSLNVLSRRSEEILNYALKVCGINRGRIQVRPIPSDELIEGLTNKTNIESYKITLDGLNLDYLEMHGINSRIIKRLAKDGGIDLMLSMRFLSPPMFTREKHAELKNEVTELGTRAKSFKVKTEDGSFDLIKENLLYYEIEIDVDSYSRMRTRLQSEMLKKMQENEEGILKVVSRNPTLDNY